MLSKKYAGILGIVIIVVVLCSGLFSGIAFNSASVLLGVVIGGYGGFHFGCWYYRRKLETDMATKLYFIQQLQKK